MLILDKDSEIMLLIGLRVAQANSPAVLMVSTYKFEIAGGSLPRLLSLLKKRIWSIGFLFFIPQFSVWKPTMMSSGLSWMPSNLDTS